MLRPLSSPQRVGAQHRAWRIRLREPHPLFRQPIDVRRLDFRLAVTTELAHAEIVGQQQHDVRVLRLCDREGRDKKRARNEKSFHPTLVERAIGPVKIHSITRMVAISVAGA